MPYKTNLINIFVLVSDADGCLLWRHLGRTYNGSASYFFLPFSSHVEYVIKLYVVVMFTLHLNLNFQITNSLDIFLLNMHVFNMLTMQKMHGKLIKILRWLTYKNIWYVLWICIVRYCEVICLSNTTINTKRISQSKSERDTIIMLMR